MPDPKKKSTSRDMPLPATSDNELRASFEKYNPGHLSRRTTSTSPGNLQSGRMNPVYPEFALPAGRAVAATKYVLKKSAASAPSRIAAKVATYKNLRNAAGASEAYGYISGN
jgi:hypothetical protein